MTTFCISILLLMSGYALYSKYIEKIFGADPSRPTPTVTMADGVDYVQMPWWKVLLIQFLNIAGLDPISEAIAGAMVYLFKSKKNYWITLIPALFMTAVVTSYIMLALEGFSLSKTILYTTGIAITILVFIWFMVYGVKYKS